MSRKILIAEDNEYNRKLIKEILLHYGYEVMEAEDGRQAVKIAAESLPDLILMDIQMPVMDGLTAGRTIKKDPATKGIKIIALTSFAMKGDRERFMEAGFDDYIAKPIDTRKLPELMKRYLEKSE